MYYDIKELKREIFLSSNKNGDCILVVLLKKLGLVLYILFSPLYLIKWGKELK